MTELEFHLFKIVFKITDAPTINDEMREWLDNFCKDDSGHYTISSDDLKNWASENEISEPVRPLYDWMVNYLRHELTHSISFEVF